MIKKKERAWIVNFIGIIAILSVFAIAALVLTNVGVRVYKNIVISNEDNFELRTSLSYLSTKIKQSDSYQCIEVKEKDGQKVLCLTEEIDGAFYETLIYHFEGKLCEIFHEKGADYQWSDGMEVMEIKEFYIDRRGDNLLEIKVGNSAGDSEKIILNIRTGR